MRKVLTLLASAILVLAACTPKDILVTDPTAISFRIDKVKSTKVFFTVTSENPNAYYAYYVANLDLDNVPFEEMTDLELANYSLDIMKESYDIRNENKGIHSSIADVSCFRGSRSLKEFLLSMDTRYRLIVFQVNPKTFTVQGEVKGESFRTQSVDKIDFPLAFSVEGNTLTVTPPDNETTYFWDFDTDMRIYDDYIGPQMYYYFLVDMYETYGFMGNVVVKGPQQREVPVNNLKDGAILIAIGAAYDAREEAITSDYYSFDFIYKDGALHPLDE